MSAIAYVKDELLYCPLNFGFDFNGIFQIWLNIEYGIEELLKNGHTIEKQSDDIFDFMTFLTLIHNTIHSEHTKHFEFIQILVMSYS